MIVKLHSQRLQSLDEIRAFLSGTTPLDCEASNRTDASGWIEASLRQLRSQQLGTADTGIVTQYLEKGTGFSRAQITRLSAQYRTTGSLRDHRGTPANAFERSDRPVDVALLAEVDALHGTLSGPATRTLCERASLVFDDRRFERLAHLSNGHLDTLRQSTGYQRQRRHQDKTRCAAI